MTDLAKVLDSAKCVFFDFDGPICRLFSQHPATDVARRLRELLDGRAPGVLNGAAYETHNAHSVLAAALDAGLSDDVAGDAERLLTDAEQAAARTAAPTPDAGELITELHALDRTLAITSNNSALAIRDHLIRHGLFDYFSPHIYGRRTNPIRLKPNPDCLFRALESTGIPADQCVMIGDSPSDWEAAETAGVPFIGYAHVPRKGEALKQAGVGLTVESMKHLLDAIGGTAASSVRPTDN